MSSRPDNAGANVRFTGAGAGAATFGASPLATASPNSGRLARVLNRCLLANIADSFPLLARSGVRLRVARGGHVETDHHRMIFVDHVVAVHHVAALPISKPHFDRGVAPRVEAHGVLARQVNACRTVAAASRPAVLAAPSTVIVMIVRVAAVKAGGALGDL